MTDYSDILVATPRPRVVRIQLNRPKQLNALRGQLPAELSAALGAAEDDGVRCVVLTGNERAFAAGDKNEGTAAFVEKRKPNFTGR